MELSQKTRRNDLNSIPAFYKEIITSYCPDDLNHCLQVRAISLAIFDAIAEKYPRILSMHKDTMSATALLHDLGWAFGRKAHHKNSMNIILKQDISDISPNNKPLVAVAARYHRRSLPQKTHKIYKDLSEPEKAVVHFLAGILRLGDALDNSHINTVSELEVSMPNKNLLKINCKVRHNPDMEAKAVNRKLDLLHEFCNITSEVVFRRS